MKVREQLNWLNNLIEQLPWKIQTSKNWALNLSNFTSQECQSKNWKDFAAMYFLNVLDHKLIINTITTKCSANELFPISNFSVTVDNGFSNWPLATCISKLGGSSILRMLLGAFCLIDSKSSWAIALTNWQILLSPPEHLPLDYSQNPEAHRAFLASVSRLQWMLMGETPHLFVHLAPALLQLVGLQWWETELL